jgi:hypothetical protein
MTQLFCVISCNTLSDCVFARTHTTLQKKRFDVFSLKPVISNKSAELYVLALQCVLANVSKL